MKRTAASRAALRCGVVQIRNRQGSRLGTGILLSRAQVLTCRHVVLKDAEHNELLDPQEVRVHCNHVGYQYRVVGDDVGEAVEGIWAPPGGSELHRDVALLTVVANLPVDPSRVLAWGKLRSGQEIGPASLVIVAHRQAGQFGVETLDCRVIGWDASNSCHYVNEGVAVGHSGGVVVRAAAGTWQALGMIVARFNDAAAPKGFLLCEERVEGLLGSAAKLARAPRAQPPPSTPEHPGPLEWFEGGMNIVKAGAQNAAEVTRQTVAPYVANGVDVARDLSKRFGFNW